MLRLIMILLIALSLADCKKNNDPEPLPQIAGIVGRWHMVEARYESGDSTVVVDMSRQEQKEFSIRFDGVMLYDGYAACCASGKYVVNGKEFLVKPSQEVKQSDECAYVDCWACEQLDITQTGDEMTVVSCAKVTQKYIRVK